MAGNIRQKRKLAVAMSMYFLEKGHVTTASEFNKDPDRPRNLTLALVKKIFGGWAFMLKFTNDYCPNAMGAIGVEEEVEVEVEVEVEEDLEEEETQETEDGE